MLYIPVILSLFFKPSVQNGGNEFDLCAASAGEEGKEVEMIFSGYVSGVRH